LESGAVLVELNAIGEGFETVAVSQIVPADAEISLEGNYEKVEVAASSVKVAVTGGTVTEFKIAETANGAAISVADSAKLTTLTLDAAVTVTGKGIIENAFH
jgi:hypothetical protein